MGYVVALVEDGLAFGSLSYAEATVLLGEPEILDWRKRHARFVERQREFTGSEPGLLWPFDIRLKLRHLRVVEALEPWPTLRVTWEEDRVEDHRTIAPPARRFGAGGPTKTQLRHEAMVVELLGLLKNKAPRRATVDFGWAGVANQPWLRVDAMPEEAPRGDGVFRSAGGPSRIVARRDAPTPLESMLVWLASSPDRLWVDTPREVVLTRDYLYARFARGSLRCLPRETLRERRGPSGDDAVYVFGRRTLLVLTHRDGCPVRAALDAQLD